MKHTEVVHTEREHANTKHGFSLFYLDQRRQAAFAFCINRP